MCCLFLLAIECLVTQKLKVWKFSIKGGITAIVGAVKKERDLCSAMWFEKWEWERERERERERNVSNIGTDILWYWLSNLLFIKHLNDGQLTVSSGTRETGDIYDFLCIC